MPRSGLRLSEEQYAEISEEYRSARYERDLDMCLRIHGLLLVNRGMTETGAAQVIGMERRTLQEWIHRYRERGIPGPAKGPFEGGKSKLTGRQKAELFRIVQGGPQEAGLEARVWTTPIIVKLVKDLYGVSYPPPDHMGRILHKLGYSVQYPAKKPSKADEKAQKTWLITRLPHIRKSPEGERCAAVSGRSSVSAGRRRP